MHDEPVSPDEGEDEKARSGGTLTEFVSMSKTAAQDYIQGDAAGNVMRQNSPHFGLDGHGEPRPGSPRAAPRFCPPSEMKTAAERIAGGPVEEWLMRNFVLVTQAIVNTRYAEEGQPLRAEMKEHLAKVKDAACFLRSVIDPPLAKLNTGPDPYAARRYLELYFSEDDFRTLNLLLSNVARVAQVSRNQIRSGGGQGRAWVIPDAQCAKDKCAVIVTEMWRLTRDKPLPKPTDPTLHAICEDYWLATGGAPSGRDGIKPGGKTLNKRKSNARALASGWRKNLERALCPNTEGDFLRRMLRGES